MYKHSIQTGIVPVLVTATVISLKFFIIIVLFFRKPTRPSLPLRKAPPLTPTLSPQERGRKPPYSVLRTATL